MQWPIFTVQRPDERLNFASVEEEFRLELTTALRQHEIKLNVLTIGECFQRYQHHEQIFDDPEINWCDRIRLTRVAWKLAKLWNYTPRADLNGRRPAELLMEQSRAPQSQQVPDEELRFVRLPGMFTAKEGSSIEPETL